MIGIERASNSQRAPYLEVSFIVVIPRLHATVQLRSLRCRTSQRKGELRLALLLLRFLLPRICLIALLAPLYHRAQARY